MAAIITGTARKNENSVATLRSKPHIMPPIMVLPEREVPGIRASICAKPTTSASLTLISSTLVTLGVLCIWRFSTHKIINPPTTNAIATMIGLNNTSLMYLLNNNPTTAAGINATIRFITKRFTILSCPTLRIT